MNVTVVTFESGILKDGLNYVVGIPHKYFKRIRNRLGASEGQILRGKVRVKTGVDDKGNPKYSKAIEFEGMILKRGMWSYYLLPDADAEKKLRQHYGDFHRHVLVEIVGVR